MSEQKHICGLTGKEFATEEEYLSHVSEVTGHTPRDLEHFGVQGIRVAQKALARTGSLGKKQNKEIDAKLAKVREEDVDSSIRAKRADKTKIFGRLVR